ncbi:hypothetical protein Syun_024515 [Stephania yunnanensis]|uniref:Thylakoid lumenal 17.9 kDa protein, chloroplastic n=1 Tax=Stephania yunnanensis TaxID=152371 RepID=A0AAP0NIR3_9MAGN
MNLCSNLFFFHHPFPKVFNSLNQNPPIPRNSQIQEFELQNPTKKTPFLPNLALSVAIATITTTTTLAYPPLPSQAIPSLNSPTSPFTQSKNLELGLQNGKIRPCPSTNPGCVSTNPTSASFAFPLVITNTSSQNPVQRLREAILKTQKNAEIRVVEDTPNGNFESLALMGGWGFGRDVLEFLVRGDIVAYRAMATKVIYVYPFTTALGDSKGQEERVKKIVEELGWYAPNFESLD